MENKTLATLILGGAVAALAFRSCVGGFVPLISNEDGIVQLFTKNNITIVTPERHAGALDDETKRGVTRPPVRI